ncbi:hypothetical protein [Nocardioides plantarum]|uniref:Uncharacterized protein n=1 Tax=Nocardioides plantarum TaxID=29299 RepID=A0ABV5K4E8_9ACTN|nr:hypothetical protein [Nocardioides plantarum]
MVARTGLLVGCWGTAALLAVVLLVSLLRSEPTGADTPEAAVARLLQGIADTDPVAIVAAIDPAEADDPRRAGAAYDRLGERLLREGEAPPLDVTAVLAAAESQLDGSVDLTAVATVAALDLELEGLDLRSVPDPDDLGARRVFVLAGDLDVTLDPDRLPESRAGLGKASYSMPLAQGWVRDREEPIEPFLVAVERDGRWYVSLEASADGLLGPAR